MVLVDVAGADPAIFDKGGPNASTREIVLFLLSLRVISIFLE